jgi:murein endopeptidase
MKIRCSQEGLAVRRVCRAHKCNVQDPTPEGDGCDAIVLRDHSGLHLKTYTSKEECV